VIPDAYAASIWPAVCCLPISRRTRRTPSAWPKLSSSRALNQLPSRLVLYLIEGERFDVGAKLSPPVAAPVDRAVEAILAELPNIAAERAD
jgi:hydrogenase maturation protease